MRYTLPAHLAASVFRQAVAGPVFWAILTGCNGSHFSLVCSYIVDMLHLLVTRENGPANIPVSHLWEHMGVLNKNKSVMGNLIARGFLVMNLLKIVTTVQ